MNIYICGLFVICVSLHAYQSSAFVLSNECPAPSPCTCSGSSGRNLNINCNSQNWKAIPQFGQYNITVNFFTLNLQSNNLTSIANNVFRNLGSISATGIEFHLEGNNINIIENDAFKGVENIKGLSLQNNDLTTIPFAISKLTHLEGLYIYGNPLQSIDSSVMSSIGGSLRILHFDLRGFTDWPANLHYLRNLERLYANYIPFTHLDANAFHGFENTLTYLSMFYAKLEKVPQAICQLTRLTSLEVDHSNNLKENTSSIFEPCAKTLPSVTYLDLNSNNLHNFPDVFSRFPSLTTLSAGDNKLEYIGGTLIPSASSLTSIFLNNNLFERIPTALNKFTNLDSLYLHANKIKTIESGDLYGLTMLKTLIIYGNPIVNIDPMAFSHNLEMVKLQMSYSQLNRFPQAILSMTKLKYLYLDGSHIDCTCDMSYLKNWDVSGLLDFTGNCASSSVTIKTFLTTTLRSCP